MGIRPVSVIPNAVAPLELSIQRDGRAVVIAAYPPASAYLRSSRRVGELHVGPEPARTNMPNRTAAEKDSKNQAGKAQRRL